MRRYLNPVDSEMRCAAQIAEAQRLAREWTPKAGQARHGAQGDGGEVGGVIMEDPLASAYRLRKGGERKQR